MRHVWEGAGKRLPRGGDQGCLRTPQVGQAKGMEGRVCCFRTLYELEKKVPFFFLRPPRDTIHLLASGAS